VQLDAVDVAEVHVEQGHHVRVLLEENPSTGYNWIHSASWYDGTPLQIVNERDSHDELDKDDVEEDGKPYTVVLTVKANYAGTYVLSLAQVRSWESMTAE